MPELPEVEIVRRGLEQLVVGKTIKHVSVTWPRIIQDSEGVEGFSQQMVGQTLEQVKRRGKFLFFYWSKDGWISHLRMEGKWLIVPHTEPVNKHTHVVLSLTNGEDLRYQDVRKFGRIHRVKKSEMPKAIADLKLGLEPSELTTEYLQKALKKTTRSIKNVLLDQHVIAGVGNIYCDEALWRAEIHPERPAHTLTDLEYTRLVKAIQRVIVSGIEAGGTTVRTYKNAFGEAGQFQKQLAVYQRAGEPCWRCDTPIVKIKVGQRGTHYCPVCQVTTPDTTVVVGLTGSIATGKSTVSRYLKQRGIPVIDFDQMVHNLQQPNTPTLAALQAQFGPEIVTRDGALDRKHLAKRVFNDSEALERLNHTMRPFIVGALQEQLEVARLHQTPLVVLDIPLLFEQHYQWWCDQVIVVSTSPRLQLERLMARNNLSKSDAELRIASQIPLVDKEQRADAVIDNSGTIDDTYCQVDQWLSELEHAFHFTKE